jgi:hypothetical protein
MRTPTALPFFVGLALTSCSVIVDPGITYRECDRDGYVEEFEDGTEMKQLYERCWELDNAENDPADVKVEDGDLIVRLNAPSNGGPREQWQDGDQAPMVFQRFDGDFVLAARVEALHKRTGDHCLIDTGNMAGLVVRESEVAEPTWATLFIGPFQPAGEPEVVCEDVDVMAPDVAAPTQGRFRSRDGRWGDEVTVLGPDDKLGIGEDGEADIAVCRVDDQIEFHYRDRSAPASAPTWELIYSGTATAAALDVGLTATGLDPVYDTEAHFDLTVLQDDLFDGCAGTLVELPFVEEE